MSGDLVADGEVGQRRDVPPARFGPGVPLLESLGGVGEGLGHRAATGGPGRVGRRRRGQLGLGQGPQPLGHPAYVCLDLGAHRARPAVVHILAHEPAD